MNVHKRLVTVNYNLILGDILDSQSIGGIILKNEILLNASVMALLLGIKRQSVTNV